MEFQSFFLFSQQISNEENAHWIRKKKKGIRQSWIMLCNIFIRRIIAVFFF